MGVFYHSSGLLFSLLAMLLYVLFIGIKMLLRYVERERQLAEMDSILAEQERQLTESRIATMISQIRPHFIYNTLGSIEQLCELQPETAAKLVHDFSCYLRGNFGEMDNPAPIRLSQEMEHVRHYVSIERIRFWQCSRSCSPICGRFRKPLSADWSRSWTDYWHRIRSRAKQPTSLAGCSIGTA